MMDTSSISRGKKEKKIVPRDRTKQRHRKRITAQFGEKEKERKSTQEESVLLCSILFFSFLIRKLQHILFCSRIKKKFCITHAISWTKLHSLFFCSFFFLFFFSLSRSDKNRVEKSPYNLQCSVALSRDIETKTPRCTQTHKYKFLSRQLIIGRQRSCIYHSKCRSRNLGKRIMARDDVLGLIDRQSAYFILLDPP